ncbi:hypothetical protein FIBSPDRAFT_961411 [Athelia psychrophila]|uniref:Ribonuclease H1 N-terminal domain-containing protein n=1 Tax=Athelia psychrophila TaxID=1759441 RepID=A0A166BB80_9AGAM|nr:hypothetical protein FIBSPDRAFT_961411 [Fibularhizoctonia sp. CBS 109695]
MSILRRCPPRNVTISNSPPPPDVPSPSPTVITIFDSDSADEQDPTVTISDSESADVQDPTVISISDSDSDDRPIRDETTGERDYLVSGLETSCIESWHRAAHATQGIPGGNARRVTIIPPNDNWAQRRNIVAWVVYEGLSPGIYNTWLAAKSQTNRVPGNVHQGFTTCLAAEQGYILAYALGCVRSLPPRGSTDPPPPAAAPTPAAVLAAFTAVSDTFLGTDWHVVFKGLCPGVYPAWNFVAAQTKGISCAVYQKYPSRNAAQVAFRAAQRAGEVEYLI